MADVERAGFPRDTQISLNVIDTRPGAPSYLGPTVLCLIGIVVGFMALADGFSTPLLLVGIGCVLLAIALGRNTGNEHRQEIARYDAWLTSVRETAARIGSLPALFAVDAPINLQRGEVCYWAGQASWHEFRRVTRRVNYHGLTVSVPIVKGVRYRLGSFSPTIERESELVPIDDGRLYLTSKRLLFDGREKNTTIQWRNVVDLRLFEGGLKLDKGTGKDVFLTIGPGAEEAAAILVRLLMERSQ